MLHFYRTNLHATLRGSTVKGRLVDGERDRWGTEVNSSRPRLRDYQRTMKKSNPRRRPTIWSNWIWLTARLVLLTSDLILSSFWHTVSPWAATDPPLPRTQRKNWTGCWTESPRICETPLRWSTKTPLKRFRLPLIMPDFCPCKTYRN